MALSRRLFAVRRHHPRASEARLILPPSNDDLVVGGSAGRQRVLDSCDRSPALFRLTASGDEVSVWFGGEVDVGGLEPRSSAAYLVAVRQTERRGGQLWAHGQIERRGVELVAVLHCAPPARKRGWVL